MASESSIIAAIENIVNQNYWVWTIGVTDNPDRRKEEHGDPKTWKHWDADTETAARNVEANFIDKGMNGGSGGSGSADYVYIF